MDNNQIQGEPADGRSQPGEDPGLPGKPIAAKRRSQFTGDTKRRSIRRVIKVFLITLASLLSLLLLLVLAASIWLYVMLKPERLTPFVQEQLDIYIPYQAAIERVELTFFSTFPQMTLSIDDLLVISPFPEAHSDTLLKADKLVATIDIRALWNDNEIILNKLHVTGGVANAFVDSLGLSNFAQLKDLSGEKTADQAEMSFQFIHLKEIAFFDTDLSYIDRASGIQLKIAGLQSSLSGTLKEDVFDGMGTVGVAQVSFSYLDKRYLDQDIVRLDIPVRLDISRLHADLYDASVSVNGLDLILNGSVGFDVDQKSLSADIQYAGKPWIIHDLLALVPPAYLAPFGEFAADGKLVARGMIKGVLSDSLFPMADARLVIEEGDLTHEWIPVPLSGINGEAYLYLDMNTPAIAYLDISRLEARSPASLFQTKGRIDDLLGDIRLDLTTDVNLMVEEFSDYIPPDMAMIARGRANGRLQTSFSLSDAQGLKFDKMLMNGAVVLSDFYVRYDTISLWADRTTVSFSLPNDNSERNGFAKVEIIADTLSVALNESTTGGMRNAQLVLETSDIRDTTAIPDVYATYDIFMLHAVADTIDVSISKPRGLFTVKPGQKSPKQPLLYLEYMSDKLETRAGNDMFEAGDTWIISNIVNDASQDDMILQWAASGFLIMSDGLVRLNDLASPIEIPVVRMDFEPESFTIHESRMKVGQSDFELSGLVQNVLSYVRGDSLLRGNFVFASEHTDLAHLMSLTSGIGAEEEESVGENNGVGHGTGQQTEVFASMADVSPAMDIPTGNEEQSFSGPYMVPRGLDLSLAAGVRQAVFGPDTITNILGEVRVSDGILVFDGIDFTTSAGDMRLTAMYRTPRKNHLYLGIDYHMFDIDISRLLQMIPDIDTLMPMLRSFQGNGEFHIAVETYLDSLYNIKKSTLRGASSIRGKDLVLLDGETFSEIAKTLRFSKKAENRVDSLAAEFTIFREEIDVYPFLIVMDRYQAVVTGRHNIDMSFNYHISLVDSPLPVRLGIDVTGNLDKLNYRLASPRYAELYRPASRRVVESRQLELRRMIREALMRNIMEE